MAEELKLDCADINCDYIRCEDCPLHEIDLTANTAISEVLMNLLILINETRRDIARLRNESKY